MEPSEDTRCGACLSVGRDVSALHALRSTYDMLMEDFAHQHNSLAVGSESPLVCWECAALLARVSELKRRVQRGRLALQLHQTLLNKRKLSTDDAKLELTSLSHLNLSTKTSYDFTFQHNINQKEEPTFKIEKDTSDDDDPNSELNPIELQNHDCKCTIKFLPNEIETKVFTDRVTVSDDVSLAQLTEIIEDAKYTVVPKEENACGSDNDTATPVKKKCSIKKLGREKRSKSARKEKKRRKALAAEEEKTDVKKTEWRCRDCGQTFVTRGKMTYHQRTVHAEPVLCNECGRVFSFKPTLEKHMLTHFGGVPQYPCAVCGKSFAGRAGIKSHMVHVHAAGGERHRCEPCDLTFKTKYKYRTHIKWSKRHGGEGTERHECEKCHRRYKTKQRLFEHYSYQHLGKAAHKCTVCDKEISSLLGLRKHMKYVHEGQERPRIHVCETCGDGFKQVAMLRQHQFIHTGERPYACDQCGATFRQKGSLYTHRRLVHLKIKRTTSGVEAPVQAPR